jgi:hypothetical protein
MVSIKGMPASAMMSTSGRTGILPKILPDRKAGGHAAEKTAIRMRNPKING